MKKGTPYGIPFQKALETGKSGGSLPGLLDKTANSLGRLGSLGNPFVSLGYIDIEVPGFDKRVIGPELINERTLAT